MKKRKLGDADPTFKVLPSAKRGHPLLIGETMDNQPNIESVRDAGGPITTLIVMTVGTAVIREFDADLLAENNGPLPLTTNWAKSLLYRMNFVKRKGCSTAKPMVHNFDSVNSQLNIIIIIIHIVINIQISLIIIIVNHCFLSILTVLCWKINEASFLKTIYQV